MMIKPTDKLIEFLVEFIQKVFHRDVLIIALPIYALCVFILYQTWWNGSYENILLMELQGDSKAFFTWIYLPIYAILLLLVRLEIRATDKEETRYSIFGKEKRNIFKESKQEIDILLTRISRLKKCKDTGDHERKDKVAPNGKDENKRTIPDKVKVASERMEISLVYKKTKTPCSLLKGIKGYFIFHIALYLISLVTFYVLIDKLFYTWINLNNWASPRMLILLAVVLLIFLLVPYYMIRRFIIFISAIFLLLRIIGCMQNSNSIDIENIVLKAKAGFEFEGLNFKDVTFDHIEQAKFTNCKMEYCNFRGVLDNVIFENCSIEIDSADASILKVVTFKNCSLTFRNYVEGKMEDVEFIETTLSRSLLEQIDFKRVNFQDSTLRKTKFKNCNWKEVKFERGTLEDVGIIYDNNKDIVFQEVEFNGTTLINLELTNKDTSGYLELDSDVKFDSSVLRNVHFTNTDLTNTNLTLKQL